MASSNEPIRLRSRLIINFATFLLNLWFSTCRITVIGRQFHDQLTLHSNKVVGATWHRGAIFLVWYFRRLRPMIMFSRSKDGELISGYAEKLGNITVRGSSHKGGREAFREMIRFLRLPGSRKAATVLDGPRGPRCIAKEGMIRLAMITGVPLIPIMISAHPAITIRKAWDKTLIPLPFSRVVVMCGAPWHPARQMGETGVERLRQEVEDKLNQMMSQCDEISGYRTASN
jgi:lysophospholipid acyltransferase (LPLAT)-like uncharacterized protein